MNKISLLRATPVLMMLGITAIAWAQTPNVDQIEGDLKERSQRLGQVAQQLDANDVSNARLDKDLQTLLGYRDQTQSEAQTLEEALDKASSRLAALGPPPDKGQPPESDDIAKLRSRLTEDVSRLTGLSTTAELTTEAIDELVDRVQRMNQARRLSELGARGASPFASELWTQSRKEIGPALGALLDYYAKRWRELRQSERWKADSALLLVALALAIALLLLPWWTGWRRFEAKLEDNPEPSPLDKRRRVALRSLSRGFVVAAAGALLYVAGFEVGLITSTDLLALRIIWIGPVVWVVVYGYAQSIFSPKQPTWRSARCNAQAAGRLRNLLVAAFSVFVVDRILEAGFSLAGAGVELTLALRLLLTALFAVLLWFLLSPGLWRAESATSEPSATPSETGTPDAPAKPMTPWWHNAIRRAGRLFAIVLLGLLALGYVPLASFLFHRLALLFLFLVLYSCVRRLALWALTKVPTATPNGDAGKTAEEKSESIGPWLRLAVEQMLLVLGAPLSLVVFGFDWLDVERVFEWFASDIHVGAVSISFADVMMAVIVFFLISAATRWATREIDQKLSKDAHVESGARNSMATLANYVGMVIGLLVALPIAGIGFSKLAIIAGALSVGIGFGLQNIVNNFVSGLILLFERPIKSGDWIVHSSGEGYVKQIGARATEIETFDRASIIIPNSELISSPVQNWFLRGRTGRLRVEVGVDYGSDPEQVRDILVQCANDHDSVMPYPAPEALFTDFADSSLNFELRAYLRNYDIAKHVRNDLRVAIFAAFDKAGISIPFPQRHLHVYTEPLPDGATPS